MMDLPVVPEVLGAIGRSAGERCVLDGEVVVGELGVAVPALLYEVLAARG